MRRTSTLLLAFALAGTGLLGSTGAQAAPAGCRVATIGNERPEWFCTFYAASDTITYTAAAASGWAIDRLIRQNNDGTIVYERLAGRPATDQAGPGAPPLDATRGTITVQPGWYIRVQVLQSVMRFQPPGPAIYGYRNGVVDAQS